ncbi:MAG: undecaprenyl-diphosphate phosphatase [Deltaproteobacteria bacterium]|nr:undecaprenyl-diphosphate phosphatase [Deltaproteobacteria bacterium]
MNLWESIVLGIIQGLTEFLPVSSSGHLVIAQSFLPGFQQEGVLFDVMVHCGTMLAVIFFLRTTIYSLAASLLPAAWRSNRNIEGNPAASPSVERRMVGLIIVATTITGIIGILLKDHIHRLFESAETAAGMLIVTGILLYVADRIKGVGRTAGDMTITDALVIGLAQAVALMPGISRSGSTIAFGIYRKIDGDTAARFSFLLSIPAVLGATMLELEYVQFVSPDELFIYGVGMIAAAITGFLSLRLLFFIIRKRELKYFSYYCWVVAATTLLIRGL